MECYSRTVIQKQRNSRHNSQRFFQALASCSSHKAPLHLRFRKFHKPRRLTIPGKQRKRNETRKSFHSLAKILEISRWFSRADTHCSRKIDAITPTVAVGLRRDCSRDVDCEHIDGAKCYDDDEVSEGKSRRVCDCQPHMVMSADENKCLPGANEIGARCVESLQCTAKLEGAECNQGKCKCRPTFHFAQTKKRCVLNKGKIENISFIPDKCKNMK